MMHADCPEMLVLVTVAKTERLGQTLTMWRGTWESNGIGPSQSISFFPVEMWEATRPIPFSVVCRYSTREPDASICGKLQILPSKETERAASSGFTCAVQANTHRPTSKISKLERTHNR